MIFCPSRDFCGTDLLTTRTDLLLQLVQALVRPIGHAFFDQRPDSLRRIQFWRVSWHADQRDSFWGFQRRRSMCGCAVPHQHKTLTFRRVLFGELVEKSLHTRGVQARQYQPEDAPRARMSCRIQPEPFIALINDG